MSTSNIHSASVRVPESANPTLAEYYSCLNFRRQNYVKKNTIFTENCWFKAIAAFFSDTHLKDITRSTCCEFQQSLLQHYSSASANSIFNLLKGILKSAVNEELIPKNPAEGIRPIRRTEPKMTSESGSHRALSDEELQIFFSYAKGSFYENYFRMMLYTGMRCGEVGALQKSDISLKNHTINIWKTVSRDRSGHFIIGGSAKTFHGTRVIPLTRDVRNLLYLQEHLLQNICPPYELTDQALLFPSCGNHKIVSANAIDAQINKILKKAAADGHHIRHFSSHAFRDTYATHALRQGMSVYVLQKLLGHSDINMTLLYAQIQMPDKIRAAESISFNV